MSFIIYAPATALFVKARREQGRRLFSPPELVVLGRLGPPAPRWASSPWPSAGSGL
ncbi:hypothetical protein [Streptomyces sp. MAI_2237]